MYFFDPTDCYFGLRVIVKEFQTVSSWYEIIADTACLWAFCENLSTGRRILSLLLPHFVIFFCITVNSDCRNWNIFYQKRTTFLYLPVRPPSGTFPVGFGYHRQPFVSTGTVEMCKGIAFERPIICSSARGLTSLTATQATNICFSSFAVWTPCFVRNVFLTTVPGCSWPRYFGFVASAFVKD